MGEGWRAAAKSGKAMRVLLIEDDMLIGNGIKAGLAGHGFSVDWFKDGLLGREALSSVAYDAVFCNGGYRL